jgi:hypothetical protein
MESAEIAHQNFIDSIMRFGHHTAAGFSDQMGGWSVLATGLPAAMLNIVTAHDDAPNGADLAIAIQKMKEADLPHSIVLRQGFDDHLAPAVLERGATLLENVPVMIGSDMELTPWPGDLTLVDGPSSVGRHASIVAAAFELPEDVVAELTTERFAADPDIDVVVGLSDGTPVTTAVGVTTGGVTGVYNVATIDGYRGRGYGAAATSAVVKAGFGRGATATSLQSSDLGLSVYEALGYRTVLTHTHYATAP